MTHRIRGSFGEHPQAVCGAPEPELVVDADEAVTCSRCRAKIVVALDHAGRPAWHTEWIRLEGAWGALDAAA